MFSVNWGNEVNVKRFMPETRTNYRTNKTKSPKMIKQQTNNKQCLRFAK